MAAVIRRRAPVTSPDRLRSAQRVRIGIVARVPLGPGERVGRSHLQPLRQTPHDVELHRVIAQRLGVEVRDELHHRPHAGILPVNRSERVRVDGRVVHQVGGIAVHVQRQLVDVDEPAGLTREVPHIGDLGHGLEADILLERHVDVVRLGEGLFEVGQRHVDGILHEPGPERRGVRNIVERGPSDLVAARHRTAAGEGGIPAIAGTAGSAGAVRSREVIEDPERAAQRGLRISGEIPGKPDPRRGRKIREREVRGRLLAREAARSDAVNLVTAVRHDVPVEGAGQQHARVGGIDGPLQSRRARLIAGTAVHAYQAEDPRGLRRIPAIGEEASVHVVDFEVRAAVLQPHPVINRQPRVHAPVVLHVTVVLPVPDVSVDAGGQFGVRRVHAQQHVGVAVARAERIIRVVAKIEIPHVIGRARLGLLVVLEVEPHLDVVAAPRNRQIVGEGPPRADIQLWNGLVGRLDGPVRHAIVGQICAIAAGRAESRCIRPLVHLGARELGRIRVGVKWLDPRWVDSKRRRVQAPVIEFVVRLVSPAIVRVPEVHFVHDGGLEYLRHRGRRQNPGRVLVHEPGARGNSVPAPIIVAVLHQFEGRASLIGQHRVHPQDVVRSAVQRRQIVRRIRGPFLTRGRVQDAVGSRQQVEHLLAQQADAISRNDVARERQPRERIDNRLDRAVRNPGLREVAHLLERGGHVGATGCCGPRIVRVFLRRKKVKLPASSLPTAVDQPWNHYGPTHAVARDVDPIERLRQVARLAEVVVRVEPVAPAVVPPRSFERTRAGLGDDADEAAIVAAIFGGVAVGDDLHFADGVHVQVDVRRAAAAFVDDVEAIDAHVLVLRRRPVDGDGNRRSPLGEIAIQVGILDSGQNGHEAEYVAALHLNVRQIIGCDRRPAGAVSELHGSDLRRDGDGLRDLAELQHQLAQIAYFGA